MPLLPTREQFAIGFAQQFMLANLISPDVQLTLRQMAAMYQQEPVEFMHRLAVAHADMLMHTLDQIEPGGFTPPWGANGDDDEPTIPD